MAKLINNDQAVEYENYQEYIEIQNSRYHDYDCQNSLNNNLNLLNLLNSYIEIKYKNILDIGCRDAAYFDVLKEKNINCYGIDISEKSVNYALSKNRNVILGDASELSLYFQNIKFDLILSNHSFEHFLYPKKILEECYSILSNNGFFVIKIPNEGDKIKNKKTLAHVFAYSKERILNLILKFKFKIYLCEILNTNEILLILKKE